MLAKLFEKEGKLIDCQIIHVNTHTKLHIDLLHSNALLNGQAIGKTVDQYR